MNNKEIKKITILVVCLIIIDQILKVTLLITNIRIGNIYGWSLGILEQTQSENKIQYILIGIVAITALIRYISSNNSFIKFNNKIIINFAIAGCISNLIDIIWNGGVINYINISKYISINLGYMYIIVTWIGMAIIFTKYTSKLIIEKRNKNQYKKEMENEKRNNSK